MLSFEPLIIRPILGLSFIGHGAQKLFGWFGGPGLKQTSGFFQTIGVKPGFPMAVLSGLTERLGGALLTVGLLTTLAGLIITATMVVAMVMVHGRTAIGPLRIATNMTC